MFDFDITQKKHFTGKDGEQSFEDWKRSMGINAEDFPFRVKTGRFSKSGHEIWLSVVSWGFYQGSDWAYYVFISYRQGQGGYTCAYHWDVDEAGKPVGSPRKHEWIN
jgi:hypothetical protein